MPCPPPPIWPSAVPTCRWPGRTHGQHAVPATFGFKVAVWIDELGRHVERFRQAAPRIFVAMLGGAAGTFASLGAEGPTVQRASAAISA